MGCLSGRRIVIPSTVVILTFDYGRWLGFPKCPAFA
jgi:hypothetical protein